MTPNPLLERAASGTAWREGFKNAAVLGEDDVFVLRSQLNLPPRRIEELASTLSKREIERANRFKFDIHRNRFVVCHGLLREVLGYLLRVEPFELKFAQGKQGKPRLSGNLSASDIRFNLSRSEDRFALAVTRARRLGVDIEFIRSNAADPGVAETHFSKRELEDLSRLKGVDWEIGFFNCWTRKEAFIKATGEGLYRPLDSFDVTLVPGQPAELRTLDSSPAQARRWKMLDLPFEKGYAGAVVAEGRDWKLTRWQYPS